MDFENSLPLTDQNLRLATAYEKMNEAGRNVLDKVIQKMAEEQQGLEKIKRLTKTGKKVNS